MNNPYHAYLSLYFETLLYYRHISSRVNTILKNDIETYTNNEALIHLASALVISDWTTPDDNGWEINFHTGIHRETPKLKYKLEIEKIISKQLLLLYAQSFESFERFLKDSLFQKSLTHPSLESYLRNKVKKKNIKWSREQMPSGLDLYMAIRFATNNLINEFSKKNNLGINYKIAWSVFSEVRHVITHAESKIKKSKIQKSDEHCKIFKSFFNYIEISEEEVLIIIDYKKFDTLIKRFSEYGFQFYKIFSLSENLKWTL
jgi:hypothetical protein